MNTTIQEEVNGGPGSVGEPSVAVPSPLNEARAQQSATASVIAEIRHEAVLGGLRNDAVPISKLSDAELEDLIERVDRAINRYDGDVTGLRAQLATLRHLIENPYESTPPLWDVSHAAAPRSD